MNNFLKLFVISLVLVITTSAGNFQVSAAAAKVYKPQTLEGECPSTPREFDQLKQEITNRFGPLIEQLSEKTEKTTNEQSISTSNKANEEENTSTKQSTVTTDKIETPTDQETIPTTTILNTCGKGSLGWRQVAFINMSDTSYNCPLGLTLSSHYKRTCHSHRNFDFCSSTIFSVGGSEYSRVCGRIIGYQFGEPLAFDFYYDDDMTLDHPYVDGVSLTHGFDGQRQHIWTFVAGLTEGDYSEKSALCPCDTSIEFPGLPPLFVGDDYFCESGTTRNLSQSGPIYGEFFPNDPLWDGQGCSSTSKCCQFNNPPWFTKDLPNPTTDDIELSLCGYDDPNFTDIPLELIELYVQ